jgi:hypothetical protein
MAAVELVSRIVPQPPIAEETAESAAVMSKIEGVLIATTANRTAGSVKITSQIHALAWTPANSDLSAIAAKPDAAIAPIQNAARTLRSAIERRGSFGRLAAAGRLGACQSTRATRTGCPITRPSASTDRQIGRYGDGAAGGNL